jgi:hypothetical protein
MPIASGVTTQLAETAMLSASRGGALSARKRTQSKSRSAHLALNLCVLSTATGEHHETLRN